MTTRHYGYIIGDNNDEGQDAASRVEMGTLVNIPLPGDMRDVG